MAKTLSKTGITTTSTIEAWHVTQSIDAFSGTDAYDITLSGSLNVEGSISGSFTGSYTGSFTGDGSGITGVTGEWDGTLNGNAQITGSLVVTQNITASGNISSSATVYGNTGSFNYLSNTNGILSGSFSGSFEGLGTNITDVPTTISKTLFVRTTGDNSTAQKTNIARPWASISESCINATSGDLIYIEPGTYIEDPFTVPSGVTLKSLGGLKSVIISASNNSATFITQEENSRLEGFTLVCPSGAFPGISYDNVGTGTIYDVTLKGQGNSIGFQIDETSATSKVIYNEIRYGGGDFDKLLYIKGGILACDGIHVPGGGNIDKVYHMEAGRLQAINTNAGNPNVSSSFYIEGGTSVILGTNLFNVQEAFHLASQDYTIQGMNVYIDDNVDKHITVDAGISGSSTSMFNLVSSHMQAAKIAANKDWVSSDHAFTFQDDGVTLTPAFRVYSDLEVGHANKGFAFGAGEGLPYNKGMEVWASGSGGVSQSLTVAATSKDDSTFDFAYSASGDCMYFGNTQKSPSIADQFLFFTGLEYKQVSTGSYSVGDLTLEIYTAAGWRGINGAQVVSFDEGYNYANNVFAHENSHEEIIANVSTDIWLTSSLFGIDARWGRVRLINPITTSPVFEQFIYTPNATLINPKGKLSFRGEGLYRQTILATGNIWGEDGMIANGEFTVGTGIGGGIQSWTQYLSNSDLDTVGDAVNFQIKIPNGTCTAYPLKIKVYGIQANIYTGNTNQTTRISYKAQDVQGILINDPSGSIIPTARTATDTTTVIAAAGAFEDITIDTVTDKVWSVETPNGLDISSYYPGDVVFMRIEAETDTFIIIGAEVSVVKHTLGSTSI